MDNITILTVTSAVLSSLIAIIAIFVLGKSNRRYQNYEKSIDGLISPQREYIETILYSDAKPLIQDPGFFSDANHLLFERKKDDDMLIRTKLPDFSFFEDMGIHLEEVKVDDKLVACLMPFNKKFDKVKKSISEACNKLGYKFRRSDDELVSDNTDIRRSIVRLILEAQVVIAVLDGRNPNVFYEIGIAQSMGKLVLMVANLNRDEYQVYGRKQPVDLLSNRLITYNSQSELKENLERTLKAIHYDERGQEKTNS